jgi:hypothetical protein
VVFIIRDRASHFGLESAALQEAALDLAVLASTLGQSHVYRRMLALSELRNKDRDTRRAARRVYWGYAARLAACVAVLLTALAVGVKGALLPGRDLASRRRPKKEPVLASGCWPAYLP